MHSATEQTLPGKKLKCTSFDLTWFTHAILNLLIPNTYTELVPRKNPNFGANDKTVKCWEFPTTNWHFPSEKEATRADGLRSEWALSLEQPSANQSKKGQTLCSFRYHSLQAHQALSSEGVCSSKHIGSLSFLGQIWGQICPKIWGQIWGFTNFGDKFVTEIGEKFGVFPNLGKKSPINEGTN